MRAIPGNCLERNFVDPIKSNSSRIQRGRVNAKHGASSCLEGVKAVRLLFARMMKDPGAETIWGEMGLVFARGAAISPAARDELCGVCGGQGGIRTHGRLPPTAVFKTAALNHSATCPTRVGSRSPVHSDKAGATQAESVRRGRPSTLRLIA